MSSGVSPASAMAARQASTVERERVDHEAPADARPPDAAEDGSVLEALVAQRRARRAAGPARARGRRGRSRRSARRAGARRPRPARSGPPPPARCARRTGSHPTMLVVRCTRASSASATLATTYGGSKAGCHRCAFTVNPTTVPAAGHGHRLGRPAPAVRADRHRRVDQLAAVVAALDAQDAVGPRGPEPLVGRGQLGERPHRARRPRGPRRSQY